MSCPLSSGYQVPCRKISGVQSIFVANSDSTFKSAQSQGYNTFNLSIHQSQSQGGDLYVPGSYTVNVNTLSNSNLLYSDYSLTTNFYLKSFTTLSLTVVVGAIPSSTASVQPITITLNNVVNNYMANFFAFRLSSTSIPLYLNQGSSAIAAVLSYVYSDTYQINNTGNTFYKIEQRLEQGSYIETEAYSEYGSVAYGQKVELTLEGYDQATKNIITSLNNDRIRVIVEDMYGFYYLLGNLNYLTATNADGGLGKTLVDGVKTTITLEGKEPSPALQLDPSVYLSGIVTQ